MCLVCRHDVRPPRPQYRGEWEPDVYWGAGRRRASFHTSLTEIWQILVALVVLTLAFGFFLGDEGPGNLGGMLAAQSLVNRLIIASIAMGSGFLLHELMHKFVAQFYGHWAEFRASAIGLAVPIPLVLLTGFIFAAPGAVVISGFVKKHENGIISAAGPATNLAIAAVALPFTLIPGSSGTFAHDLATIVLFANTILGLFNLIPLGALDGKKILRWNKLVYFGLVAGGIALLVRGSVLL